MSRFVKPLALALCMLLAASIPLLAQTSFVNTAFFPDVQSRLFLNQWQQNETYSTKSPHTEDLGARFLLQDFKTTKASFLELVSLKEPKLSLLQYSYADSSLRYDMEANAISQIDFLSAPVGKYSAHTIGLRVNSSLNSKFRARATYSNTRFHGDREAMAVSPLVDGYQITMHTGTYTDKLNGELSYNDKHFSAALGRGRFQIGNSISGSVVLSDRVSEYDYALLEQRFGQFSFSFLHGSLKADTLKDGRFPAKFAAVHQVTWQPKPSLDFFYGESVFYGNRLDFSYLLPANYWRVGKYRSEPDNLNLYGGMNIRPDENWTLYWTLLLDELTPRKFFSNWWGNKYAFQTGAACDLPILNFNPREKPRLALEFTAVRPWTYTHYDNIAMFSHENSSLGYPKGSNLLDLTAEFNLPLPLRMRWDSQYSLTWQGSEGNDWRVNYRDAFPTEIINQAEAFWLDGELSRTHVLQNALRIGVFTHHDFLLAHRSTFGSQNSHIFYANWQTFF
ncbi:MAG: hypothetical protein GXY81_00840 [Candidatus Cloacimonetes bacterium]|mgnify:CR=1 FL=1|nr:hypothetical protein [Candidatus Cloacimonadota bacterium]